MTAEPCRAWREALGAHALGHLEGEERAALEAHLEGCPACRDEARSLAPLPRLLDLADPGRLDAPPLPPPSLPSRVAERLSAARRARRRKRIGLSIGGASTAAAAVLVALVLLDDKQREPTGEAGAEVARRVSFRTLPPGASITAELEPRASGTVIRIGVDGLRSGTLCRVFLRRRDGARVAAGSFRYSSAPGDDAVLTSSLDLPSASALVLVAGRWTYTARLR